MIPYKQWRVQREDMCHARHVQQARASVNSRYDHMSKLGVDKKRIMTAKMNAVAIDRDNQLLLGRLQKIHSRADKGWHKSDLYERLSPQFRRNLAQVRSGQQAELFNKNQYDKKRIKDVTAFVRFEKNSIRGNIGGGFGFLSPSAEKVPQRPSGLRKARKLKESAQRKLVQTKSGLGSVPVPESNPNGLEVTSTIPSTTIPATIPATIPLNNTRRREIDNNMWKLVYRAGVRLDMVDPSRENSLCHNPQLSVISMWRLRSTRGKEKSHTTDRLLIVSEDVKTLLKKSVLLRSNHIRHMMTMVADKQQPDNSTTSTGAGKGRKLDSRGWDHAVQIPHFASISFDDLNYHLKDCKDHYDPPLPKKAPSRPTGSKQHQHKFYQLIVNSLVISADLALAVQHPLDLLLSRRKINHTLLTELVHGEDERGVSLRNKKEEDVSKDPRDRLDANCTFSPKIVSRPLRKKRNEYERKAASTLERSRRIVLCHGMEYAQQVPAALVEMNNQMTTRSTTGISTKEEKEARAGKNKNKRARRQDIARRQRLVDQVSREAALKDTAIHYDPTKVEDMMIDDLHDGASKIQSVFRRRQAGTLSSFCYRILSPCDTKCVDSCLLLSHLTITHFFFLFFFLDFFS